MSTTHEEHVRPRSESRSHSARRGRVAAWAGIGFAPVFFASWMLGSAPDIHNSVNETLSYYAQDANNVKALVAWGLSVLAVLMLVWFLVELVRHLRTAGDGRSPTLPVTLAGGVLVTTVAIASAIRAAPAGDLLLDSEERAGTSGMLTPTFADFAQTAISLSQWLLFFGVGLGAAALVVSVSLAARYSSAIPRWLRWAGYAAAPVLAFVAFFNILVLLLWVVAVSVVLIRQPGSSS